MSDTGTYNTAEISTYDAKDIWLYLFTRGNALWCYTSADRNIQIDVGDGNGSQTYYQLAISDGGIKQSGEATTDDVTITVPSVIPIVTMFRGTPPSDNIGVVIRRMQYGDTDAPITWMGYISSVKYKDAVSSEIVCNTEVASIARKGLRKSWERGCVHALFDDGCTLNASDWSATGVIDTLDGDTITFTLTGTVPAWVNANPGVFSNGYVQWNPDPDYFERRGIQVHTPNSSTPGTNDSAFMLAQTDGMTVGMAVTLVAGCQRIPANCLLPFNNIANYGGYPFLPGKSPYDGDPVF